MVVVTPMTAYACVKPPTTPPTSPATGALPGVRDKAAFSACRELTSKIAPLVEASNTAYVLAGCNGASIMTNPWEKTLVIAPNTSSLISLRYRGP